MFHGGRVLKPALRILVMAFPKQQQPLFQSLHLCSTPLSGIFYPTALNPKMNIWIFSSQKNNLHLALILLAVHQPSDVYLHGVVVSGDVVAFGEGSMAQISTHSFSDIRFAHGFTMSKYNSSSSTSHSESVQAQEENIWCHVLCTPDRRHRLRVSLYQTRFARCDAIL